MNSFLSLAHNGIWCAHAKNQNDPNDSLTEFQRQLTKEQLGQFREFTKSARDSNLRIIGGRADDEIVRWVNLRRVEMVRRAAFGALSETWKSKLMWSHYAEGHKGFVIGIDFPVEDETVKHLLKVKYVDKLPDFDLIEWAGYYDVDDSRSVLMTLKDVTVKEPNWYYEKEWRIWRKEECYFNYDVQMVRELYVGSKFDHDRYLPLLRKLIGKKAGSDLLISQVSHSELESP